MMFQKIVFLCLLFSLGSSFVYASYSNLVNDLVNEHGIDVSYPDSRQLDVFVTAKDITFSLIDSVLVGVENTRVVYKDLSIKAHQLRFSVLDNTLRFLDSVFVTKDDFVLTCMNATALFPSDIFVDGNVQFIYRDYQAMSERARYDLNTNLIALQGNAVFLNKDDYLKGDYITFDLDNESVVSGGRAKIKVSTKQLQE